MTMIRVLAAFPLDDKSALPKLEDSTAISRHPFFEKRGAADCVVVFEKFDDTLILSQAATVCLSSTPVDFWEGSGFHSGAFFYFECHAAPPTFLDASHLSTSEER
ncbi:MAG TPA: hypothetical protein VM848_04260 [Acidimicrobiia bacterium]|nr:hypothetical protein [Acidimicrobiia bacterium]